MTKNTVILTSSLNLYDKDENGNRIAHEFSNENGILDLLKKETKKYDNFLFVASDEYNSDLTDIYAGVTIESFALTLPFKNYDILDYRTKSKAIELIKNADLIYLSGGHLPTQNKFFNDINLKSLIKNSSAVIIGGSAGSMNCADKVYCPPELDGESLEKNFKRYLNGLGLTNINILPHYNDFCEFILDEKEYIKEIILPDSYKTKILAINDGSYIIIKDGKSTLFGEGYAIENGKIIKICENNQKLEL